MRKKLLFLILILFACLINVKAESTTTDPTKAVAKVNDTYFLTLTGAINEYESDEFTITVLKDTSELISIPNGKKIVLDLNGHTLSNTAKNTKDPVITNNGTLEVKNGTVTTDAKAGAINNNSKGIVTISSGNIIATKLRQALYNKGGQAYITGTAYLEAVSIERAAVHNLDNGKMYITGGTIVSKGYDAVYNEKGTVNIGTKDGDMDTTTPTIQGYRNGILLNTNQKFNFYDGTIKGITNAIEEESGLDDTEDYAVLKTGEETIESKTYKTAHMELDSNKIKITFDPTGGTSNPNYKIIDKTSAIGTLPVPIKVDNKFDGWFTAATGGEQITENTKPTANTTYYAHWTYDDPNTVTYVEGVGYRSLKNALAIGGKITLMKDVIIDESLAMNKEAIIDLNGHTIDMTDKMLGVYKKITITDSSENKTGKITSTAEFTMVVGKYNETTNGNLIVKGGTIEGLGAYGAIRNYETTEIDGGTVQGTATTKSSFVIYNNKNLTITSGTVYSTNGSAVQTVENSTFTMDGGLLKTDAINDQAMNLSGNCVATINDGTIEAINTNGAGIAAFGGSTLVVNGGTITGYDMAIAGNGSDNNKNVTITINGGTMIATNGIGMYLPQQNSTTTINGGIIEGKTGIEIRAANLIVNDGYIIGTNDTYEVKKNDSGTTTKGAAIAVSQHNTKQPIHVEINGGNLKAVVPLTETNPQENPPEAIELIEITVTQGDFESTGNDSIQTDDTQIEPFVTGGIYTNDPTNYVKDGYGVIITKDNKYLVTKIHSVTVDSSSIDLVTVDKEKHPYKDTVELTVKNKKGYETVVEVTDTNGNKIEVNDNKFIMPDSDVTIKVTYKEIINPNTGDNIIKYIVLLIVSSIGFGILLKKVLKA